MIKNKAILGLLILTAFASWCSAGIEANWYWVPGIAQSGGRTGCLYDPANEIYWHVDAAGAIDIPGAGTGVVLPKLTAADPNVAFFAIVNQGTAYGIAMKHINTSDPTRTINITAPFTYEAPLLTREQDVNAVLMNAYNTVMEWGDNGSTNTCHFNFSDLKFQGTMRGFRPNGARCGGKITLTGPTAISMRSGQTWYLDAELDASAVDELYIQFFERDTATTSLASPRLNCSKTWFSGTWVLDSQVFGDKAGAFGDADIVVNGAGTPVRNTDRRSGRLQVNALNAVASTAKLVIDTTSFSGPNPPYNNPTSNPQCFGGKVFVTSAASPLTVRELWVDGVQKAPGTYYSTDSANNSWFGTVTGGGRIVVTGALTSNLTMASVDGDGNPEPNLTTYPRAGTTKAFAQGYILSIKANDPIVTPNGTSYKFSHWSSSTGSGIANTSAAQTTVTIPTTDITITAHYILAAKDPSPANGATEVAMTTDLDWTPANASAPMSLYFGTDPANLVLKKSFPDGNTHGATNAEIGGPLDDTTTYYWRVNTNGNPGATWSFKTQKRRPENPTPAVGATGIERNRPHLNWGAGHASATAWDVYFGSNQAAVANAANTSDPTYLTTRHAPDANDVNAPNNLTILTPYYWRVDEHNTYGTLKGFVWTFTTRGPLCMGAPVGDLTGDCRVTFADFAFVTKAWVND